MRKNNNIEKQWKKTTNITKGDKTLYYFFSEVFNSLVDGKLTLSQIICADWLNLTTDFIFYKKKLSMNAIKN